MSKIQAMFSARGRRLYDSERAEIEAFNTKYAGASTKSIVESSLVAPEPKGLKISGLVISNDSIDRALSTYTAASALLGHPVIQGVSVVGKNEQAQPGAVTYTDAKPTLYGGLRLGRREISREVKALSKLKGTA